MRACATLDPLAWRVVETHTFRAWGNGDHGGVDSTKSVAKWGIVGYSGPAMQRSVLLGEFEFTLDAKNRVAIPARLRPAFADGIYLTRSLDDCLEAYSEDEWQIFVEERTKDLPGMSEKGREVRRFLFGAATNDRLDGQGRVKIPANLLAFAGISREVTILGLGSHIEIWDRAAWATYRTKMEEGAHAAADQLAGQ
jgi:MraZ protein